ncbi:MAG: hypothetical protein SCM96_01195 [Acidobacteriota bacterium]|nr:hypothetical protein [Acidobacteriota bacterium]
MKKPVKVASILLMVVLFSFYAAAFQKPADQQTGAAAQLEIDGPDVITASDAGGGALTSRDLLIIVALGVGLVVFLVLI